VQRKSNELLAGYCQFRPRFGRVRENLEGVIRALRQVRADLIVLPELPFTGYHFRDRSEALALAEDPRDSDTVAALARLCKRKRMHLVTGFAERRRDRVFNSALLIGPQGLRHVYRKLHLFKDEKSCFDPGDIDLSVQTVNDFRIGMMVCFDWAFPEVARTLALKGAQLLCHPANLVLAHCQQAMLTRSLENAVYAVTANRTGADRRPHGVLRFTGGSQITAPGGRLLHRAPAARAKIHVTALDMSAAGNKWLTPRNHLLRDRRPEFYLA